MQNFNRRLSDIKGRLIEITANIMVASTIASNSNIPFKEIVVLRYKQRLIKNLEEVLYSFEEEDILREKLVELLVANWSLVQCSFCCYTALPQDELTVLLCDIAELLSEKDLGNKAAITFLMPGVQTVSISDQFENLNELSLKKVLRTHVTSDCGNYLIPVRILVIPAHMEFLDGNPYYNYELNGVIECTKDELNRLNQHSSETRALSGILKEIKKLESDEKGLLGQLQTLQKSLALNGVNGVGYETDAGIGAYPAILYFSAYWQLLTDEIKRTVPIKVLKEIELILNLSTPNESDNINRRKTLNQSRNYLNKIESCIAIRSQNLRSVMSLYRDSLALIQPSKKNIRKRVESLQTERDEAKRELERKIDTQVLNYYGQDVFGVTSSLLQTLEIKLDIRSLKQLRLFIQNISAQEIKALRDSKMISYHCLLSLGEITELLLIIDEAMCREIIPLIASSFQNKTLLDIKNLLWNLSSEKIKVLCEGIKKFLSLIIKNYWIDFKTVLDVLDTEQRRAMIVVMKDRLPEIIQDEYSFKEIFEPLNTEQRTEVIEIMKDQLPKLIKSSYYFSQILKLLNPKQIKTFCIIMKQEFQRFIEDQLESIKFMLTYVTPAQKRAIEHEINKVGKQENVTCFLIILCPLNPEQIKALCEEINDQLSNYIISIPVFLAILDNLINEEQKIAFCKGMKNHFPSIIKSFSEFINILQLLNEEQKTICCEGMQKALPKLPGIKNTMNLKIILKLLYGRQLEIFYDGIKSHLSDVITSVSGLKIIFSFFQKEKIQDMCTRMGKRIFYLIHSLSTLSSIVVFLSEEKRTAFCEGIKNQLPLFVKDASDCKSFLRLLTPVQIIISCEGMKEKLQVIIKRTEDLAIILKFLNLDQVKAFCEAMGDEISQIIRKNPQALFDIFQQMNEEKIHAFSEVMHNKLLLDAVNFSEVLDYLYTNNIKVFLEATPYRFTTEDFRIILNNLSPNQIKKFCTSKSGHLTFVFKRMSDFNLVMQSLPINKKIALFENKVITKRFLNFYNYCPTWLNKDEINKVFSVIANVIKDNIYYQRKFYKLNGGGPLATRQIYGFFNLRSKAVVENKMWKRAKKRPNGASAKMLKFMGSV